MNYLTKPSLRFVSILGLNIGLCLSPFFTFGAIAQNVKVPSFNTTSDAVATYPCVSLVKTWCDGNGDEVAVPPLSSTVTLTATASKSWLKIIYPAGDTANPILISAVDKPVGAGASWPAEVSATFNSLTSLTATSTKNLSNVVLLFADGVEQKFDALSGYSKTFSGTGANASKTIVGAWIHSGNNWCGDPSRNNSYGTFFGRALMIAKGVSYTVSETGLPSGWSCVSGLGTFTSNGGNDTHAVRNQFHQTLTASVGLMKTAGTALDGEVYTICGAHLVTYTYAVTNIGPTWLKSVVVTDDKLGAIGTVPGPIAPGASSVLKVDAMVSAGVTNTGTVVATPCTDAGAPISGLSQVSASDQAVVAVLAPIAHESVTIVKKWYDANTNLLSTPPALSSEVTITASNAFAWAALIYPAGNPLPPFIVSAVMKPEGASASWPEEVRAIFDSVSKTVTANSTKSLSNVVLKFADGAEQKFDGLTGYVQSFSGTGANLGKDIAGVWIKSGDNASGDGPGFGSYLAPALMVAAGASYTVTESGLPTGWTCYSGLGGFTSAGGNDLHTVKNLMPADPVPSVRIVKTAGTALDGEVYTLDAAGAVTYTFVIQNTGNTWLKDLTATDDKIGAIGTVAGPIAPSASETFTATVTVSSTVTNIGSVTATPCTQAGGTLTGAPSSVTATDTAAVRLRQLSEIGDVVWYDTNANGLQDAGEPGFANVTVGLCDGNGNPLGVTTVTDANGNYRFSNLVPGSYSVHFAVPYGYVLSPFNEGDDDVIDSDADSSTAKTPSVSLDEGTTNLTLDAGIWSPEPAVKLVKTAGTALDGETYTINGAGEVTYSYVVKNTGNTWLMSLSVTDDKLGFIGVVAGLLGPGEEATLTTTVTVSDDVTNVGTVSGTPVTPYGDPISGLSDVSASDSAAVIVKPLELASLGNRVWVDANCNGVQDPDEPGLIGVTVTLLDAAGATLKTTLTASDGSYLFSNLPQGSYRLLFMLPSTAWHFVAANQGTDDSLDSNADPATGLTPLIALVNGQNELTYDAGVYGGLPPGFCDRMTIGENFNALIIGDFTATGGDTEGRLAVGGNATFIGGYSIAMSTDLFHGEALPPLIGIDDMLIVRGNLADGPWGVNGNVVHGGTRTGTERYDNPSRRVTPVTLNDKGNVPADGSGTTFEAILQQLKLASAMISTMDNRGVVTNDLDKSDYVMTFVGNDPVLNVFNVNASDWSGSQMDILIRAPEYSTVVFNIHGSSVELSNGAIRLTGITNDRILFNYADATRLTTSSFTHEGSVLAPYADGTFSGGSFEGFGFFGGSVVTSNGFEFHRHPFRGAVCTEADASPAIKLVTTAGDAADGSVLTVLGGSDVTASYCVSNSGNTWLSQVTVTDALLGMIGSLNYSLAPGGRATLTAVAPAVSAYTVLHGTATGRPVRGDGTVWNGYVDVSATDDAAIQIGSPSTPNASASTVWQRADFAVTGIEFITKPSLTGEVFSVQVTVENHGDVAANAGRLSLYLSKPAAATVGEPGDASMSVGVLMPGESKTLIFQNLTTGSGAGTQHLRAYVDSLDSVCEWSEGDNQLTTTYALNAISLNITSLSYGVQLSWNSYWGQKYTLYRCTDLSQGFLLFKSHVEATYPTNTFIDADIQSVRFYRLAVEEQ